LFLSINIINTAHGNIVQSQYWFGFYQNISERYGWKEELDRDAKGRPLNKTERQRAEHYRKTVQVQGGN